MTNQQKIWASIGVGSILLLVFLLTVVGTSNKEINLRQQVIAQQKANTVVFDNTWKILKQEAQVTDQYRDAFEKIYPALISGRYSKGDGSLMKWITESNPQFDTRLYQKLMVSIEGQRNIFTRNQERLIDLQREHSMYLKTWPNSWIVGSRGEIAITLITSGKTKETFKTGEENDTNLFGK
jgi:hypothetical protein